MASLVLMPLSPALVLAQAIDVEAPPPISADLEGLTTPLTTTVAEPGGNTTTQNRSITSSPGSSVIGGAGGACVGNLISSAAISVTIAALSAAQLPFTVPSTDPANNLGQGFDSGTNFLDYLKVNCLDPAARAIYRKMLIQVNQSVTNWSLNGFKGGPLNGVTFPDDVGNYFTSIGNSAIQSYISEIDPRGPFGTAIAQNIYNSVRGTDRQDFDLADTIIASQCESQMREIEKNFINQSGGVNSNSLIQKSLLTPFNSLDFPTNDPGYKGLPGSTLLGQPFGFNSIFPSTRAYAQADISPELRAAINTPLTTGGAPLGTPSNSIIVNDNPVLDKCTQTATTASAKRSVLQNWANGNTDLAANDWHNVWYQMITNCSNRPGCAERQAEEELSSRIARNTENERTNLLANSGNTGIRVCTKYIPLSADDIANGVKTKTCRDDGWQTVTPGSVVSGKLLTALDSGTENVSKLSAQGTFQDLAQAVLTGLINGLTTQLLNNAQGLLSFNSRSGSSNQGEFTRGVIALTDTSTTNPNDLNAAISKTSNYVATLTQTRNSLDGLISAISETQDVCKGNINSSFVTLFNVGQGSISSDCNIDPYTQNYRDDPTAGARLANNTLYKEVGQLENTKASRDQITTAISNAQSTLSSLRQAQSEYESSDSPDRENIYSQKIAVLSASIPTDDALSQANSQKSSIESRLQAIKDFKDRVSGIQTIDSSTLEDIR